MKGEGPHIILAITESVSWACRGYPEIISHGCVIGEDWRDRLDAARVWLGDNESRAYHWLLASYWG